VPECLSAQASERARACVVVGASERASVGGPEGRRMGDLVGKNIDGGFKIHVFALSSQKKKKQCLNSLVFAYMMINSLIKV
jgi:hypothetical protein